MGIFRRISLHAALSIPLLALAVVPGTVTAAPAPPPETIVCFGDSLTAGHGADEGHAYPDYLRSDLAQAGYQAKVIKAGVSGATTKDGVDSLPHILAMHADVVIVELGANDGLRGLPVVQSKKNLDLILTALQKSGTRILLLGIMMPPNYGEDYVKSFNGMYPTLAHTYKVPLMPFILKDVYGNDALMSEDGIHPNGDGYRVVAKNVLPFLTPLLKK